METQGHKYDEVEKTVQFLQKESGDKKPLVGIICGSGLGGLVAAVENKKEFPYVEIPNFPISTVDGHVGKLVFGDLSGKPVVCLQGRFHFYEGHSIHKITFPVRVLANLGIKYLIVTNAAGGVNPAFNVGDIMIIKDHIGFPVLSGSNPLVGLNDDRFGTRFPSMTRAYDRTLQKLAADKAQELGYDFIRSGVYAMVSGPSYETASEVKLIHTVGGDAVGMSTVPEVIVGVHSGVKVLGMSLITNKCIMNYDSDEQPNHAEVLEVGKRRSENLQEIVKKVVSDL